MRKIKHTLLFGLALSAVLAAGCQKNPQEPAQPTVTVAPSGNENVDPGSVTPGSPNPNAEDKIDENGNQTDVEHVDLAKAVAKEYAESNVPYSAKMRITINPDLLLYLDGEGTVLAYTYENADAADAYKDLSFTGDNVKDTVKKVTAAALETNYLKPNADMVIEVAEVKDESFKIEETMYIAEVTANKTLREKHEQAEVKTAMAPQVETIAETQEKFELANLSEPQDLQYLTDMLDYSATMEIETEEKLVLFLDDAGNVLGYGYDTEKEPEKEQAQLDIAGKKIEDATKEITKQWVEENKITEETSLNLVVAEVVDQYFPTNKVCEEAEKTINETLSENELSVELKVEKPEDTPEVDPVKPEEPDNGQSPDNGENPEGGDNPENPNAGDVVPEGVCGRCRGEGLIECGHCDNGIITDCPTCHGQSLGACTECGGSKTIPCDLCEGSGYDPKNCAYCKGTGNCPGCGGSGKKTMEDGNIGPCNKCGGDGHCRNLFNGVTAICYGHGPCPRCHMKKVKECTHCRGTGEEICNNCLGEIGGTCGFCNGSGRETCPDCDGTGKSE